MTALDSARWQGVVAGLLLGALAGAVMEEAGLAHNATAAIVLAVIGGLLGHRAGERLHRRRLRRRAEGLAGAAGGRGTKPGGPAAGDASPGTASATADGGRFGGRSSGRGAAGHGPGDAAAAASVDSLEAVLADLDGLRDDAAPSHGRIVAAVAERARALTAVFDLLVRERRIVLEPGVSAPVDRELAAAVAARFEAFCDRAALDGVAPGEAMADYVAAAVDRRVVDLDPLRGSAGTASGTGADVDGASGMEPDGASAPSGDGGPGNARPRPDSLRGGGLDLAVLRVMLVLLVQVEQLRRTADRTTRDPRALDALATLKRRSTAGTAVLLGRPSPWYVERWFPTVASN